MTTQNTAGSCEEKPEGSKQDDIVYWQKAGWSGLQGMAQMTYSYQKITKR